VHKIFFSFRLFSLSPFFFHFIGKGKESSLHPLRSLPDPFVSLGGAVPNSFFLPENLLLMVGMSDGFGVHGFWHQTELSSNPTSTTY
jgi:hypothetical protein